MIPRRGRKGHVHHLWVRFDRDGPGDIALAAVVVAAASLPNGVTQVAPPALAENLTPVQ